MFTCVVTYARPTSLVFPLFCVTFSPQCWCGDANTDYDKHGTSHRCNYRCSGNGDEHCGGHLAMNVYEYHDVAPVPEPDNAMAKGCYKDVGDDRIMRGKYTSRYMTTEVMMDYLSVGLDVPVCWIGELYS